MERIEHNREIEELKKQQKEAVLEQNYEKAAELRDKIRALENPDNNKE